MMTDQERRTKELLEEASLAAVLKSMSPADREVYDYLNKMIDDLESAGVDVSYFPTRAYMILARSTADLKLKFPPTPEVGAD